MTKKDIKKYNINELRKKPIELEPNDTIGKKI